MTAVADTDTGRYAPSGRDPPLAVLVCGAPGSGKSTVGALVARGLRAALLDLDTATASLVAVIGELHGTDNLDDPSFARRTRAARYEALTSLAEDNLAAGISAVMVAPFTLERRDPAGLECPAAPDGAGRCEHHPGLAAHLR